MSSLQNPTRPSCGRSAAPHSSLSDRLRSLLSLNILALALSGCSPTYVLRAGYEEAKILWRREPIEQLLQRADLDAETRSKLELVLAVRAFAKETLYLRVNGSYASLARVDSDQVVHVVSAAERLRLQPHTWWFPIVGRVPYKGFFNRAEADAEAAVLERAGYDTYVRPSVAFSTLGWFADPLLSNLLRYDRVTLASIIIHELLHNTTYLAGRADFDESFATFVGVRGAIGFFQSHDDPAAVARATAEWDDDLVFSDFIGRFTSRLAEAYESGIEVTARQRFFDAGQDEFRHLALRTSRHRDFGAESLNNAVILQQLLYANQLRLFDHLLLQHDGELARVITMVRDAVQRHPQDPFAAVSQLLHREPAVAASCDASDSTRGWTYGSIVPSRRIP